MVKLDTASPERITGYMAFLRDYADDSTQHKINLNRFVSGLYSFSSVDGEFEIGEDGLKPDTQYVVEKGKFVEREVFNQ